MIHTEEQRQAFLDDVKRYGREFAEAKHGYGKSNTDKVGDVLSIVLLYSKRIESMRNDQTIR